MENKIKYLTSDENGTVQPVSHTYSKETGIHNLSENERKELTAAVIGLLHKLGISARLKGYLYLRKAIMLAVELPGEMSAVTKVLYPEIAKMYSTTPSCVERNIRHAIATAWERGNLDTLSFYFSSTVKSGRGKPTNSEFIAMISEYVKTEFFM